MFEAVYDHLVEDGLFIFDVNTVGELRRLGEEPPWVFDFGEHVLIMDVSSADGRPVGVGHQDLRAPGRLAVRAPPRADRRAGREPVPDQGRPRAQVHPPGGDQRQRRGPDRQFGQGVLHLSSAGVAGARSRRGRPGASFPPRASRPVPCAGGSPTAVRTPGPDPTRRLPDGADQRGVSSSAGRAARPRRSRRRPVASMVAPADGGRVPLGLRPARLQARGQRQCLRSPASRRPRASCRPGSRAACRCPTPLGCSAVVGPTTGGMWASP